VSNIITINNNSTNLSVTVPAPISNSQITVLEPTTAFISYDTLAAAGAGEGYVNIVTGDSRIIINKENNTVNISFDDTGLLTSETLTTLSLVGNSLQYSDEEGDTTSIDLSSYLDNTNDFLNAASFNSNDGTLTLNVQNQPDVTVNLDGRYLTGSSLGADLSDQYIPKYQSSTSSLVDSKEYETVNAMFVSTDNTADTAAIGLHYNPAVEEAVTEVTITGVDIIDSTFTTPSRYGFFYSNDKYLSSYGPQPVSGAPDFSIALLDVSTGDYVNVWEGTYLSDPDYDKFVSISSTRFIGFSEKITNFGGSIQRPGVTLFSFDGTTATPLHTINLYGLIDGLISLYYDADNSTVILLNGQGKIVYVSISNDVLAFVSDNQSLNISGHKNDNTKILDVYNGYLYWARKYTSPSFLDDMEIYKMQLTGSFVEPSRVINTSDYRVPSAVPNIGTIGAVSPPAIDLYSNSIWMTVSTQGANLFRLKLSDETFSLITSVVIPSADHSGGVLYDSYYGILYLYHLQYDSGANVFYYNDIYDVDADGTLNLIGSIEHRVVPQTGTLLNPTASNKQNGSTLNFANAGSQDDYFAVTAPFYNNPINESDLYLQEDTIKTKVELTYGDYSILPGDSQVDPIGFFGLNTDGAIYAAKSPDSESHHWYTNEFSTGYYIKVMSLDQDGLIIYKASDETSAVVTKDSIDNWNYAYNNTIEALSFNSSTGVITATQLDGGTLTVDISALYDDTDTTYTVSTSDNVSSGVDVNLVGSDSTTDSINIVGAADVTVTQANDVITISAPHETTTSLSFNSGTLRYRDEDNTYTNIDLTGLSYDTTYDLNAAANATAGVDVSLVGSDSTTDTLNIKGANDVSVSLINGDIVVDAPHETTTSLSFNSANARLTYTDEDGTGNIVSLASLVETVTSISFTSSTNTITYVDENNTSTDLVLDVYDYEIAQGTLASNTMPVVLNDAAGGSSSISILGSTNVTIGNPSQNVISIASQDTTYDLNVGGTANGTVTVTLTDGTNDDVITIVGTNDVAVTQSAGTITIDAPHETTTSISFSGNEITYTDEDNAGTVLNLDLYDYNLTTGSLAANQVPIELRNPYGLIDDVAIVGGTNVTIGTPAAGSISISSQDTTYDLLSGGAANGTVTVTLTDGTNNDVIDIVGTNDVTVTQSAGTITIDAPHETTTSISFASNIIAYVDEDGVTTTLDLSAYVDTTYDLLKAANATSGVDITLDGSDGTLDTVNFRGINDATVSLVGGNVTIDVPHETTTSISLANDTITYRDEDGGFTNLSLLAYLDDTDTTYTVSTTNAVSGANIVLTAGGSGSGTDSVSIVGGNNVTVTQAADVITVAAADETLTSLSLSSNILSYVDEDGTSTNLDLSLYLDDTNLARLVSGTLNGATGIATFTRDDSTTFTVDLSALFDDTDSTYDLNVSTNVSSGVDVNLVAGGASTGTDTVIFRGANGVAVTQAAGVVTIDGAVASSDNYVDALAFNTTSRVITIGRTGALSDLTATIPDNYVDALSFNTSTRVLTIGRTGSLSDLTATVPDNYVDNISWASGTGVLTIGRTGSLAGLTVNLDGRYLQSYTEIDTLQSVTDRGNTTTNNMQVYSGTTNHTWIKPSEIQFKGGGAINPTANTESLGIGAGIPFTNIDLKFLSNFRISRDGGVVLAFDTGLLQERMAFNSVLGGQYSGSTLGGQANFAVGGTGEFTGDLVVNNDAYITGDLEVTGTVTATSYSNSSIKYKKNVEDLEDKTGDVMKLRPVRYDLKKNDKTDIGLIAEEVEEIFPEVIGYKDGEVNGIDYARLSVVLLQQVQKQQSVIDSLEERLKKLEEK